MTSSLLLTNVLFCGIATLLLLPILKNPNTLTYKKGIPIYIIVSAVILKLFIPYEFSFTRTLASKNLLPFLKIMFGIEILNGVAFGNCLLWVWGLISLFLLLHLIIQQRRLNRILNIVQPTKNIELISTLSELCYQREMRKIPNIIQLDTAFSPFIIGFHSPVIVLPTHISYLSKNELQFILKHELEHLIHNHILIKRLIEIVTVIYWWNPIVWLLRKELLRALELQADLNVIKDLSKNECLTYLETLVRISKNISIKRNTNVSLSFTLKNSMIGFRVSTILNFHDLQKRKMSSIRHICLLALSTTFLLFPVMYTFEAYYTLPSTSDNTFTIDTKTDYFILRDDKFYDLYIDGEYVITFDNKPDDFSNLPVHE